MAAPKRWIATLGVATASVLLGLGIASETMSGMDPFYRFATPPGRREPAAPAIESAQAPPITYTPIAWSAEPPADLPPPATDPYDDAALLSGTEAEPSSPAQAPSTEPPIHAPAAPVQVEFELGPETAEPPADATL